MSKPITVTLLVKDDTDFGTFAAALTAIVDGTAEDHHVQEFGDKVEAVDSVSYT